jgi:hypothetical protein
MAPVIPKRSIFRARALQKYIRGREKSILPRIVAPPVFVFCWLLLALLILAGLVAWLGQIPSNTSGSGVILTNNALPSGRVHTGLPVLIHIGNAGPDITRSVDYINPAVLSPGEVRRRYGLDTADPALVIVTRLGPDISRRLYAGSNVQVQVRVGSQRLLSLFPLLSDMLKDA